MNYQKFLSDVNVAFSSGELVAGGDPIPVRLIGTEWTKPKGYFANRKVDKRYKRKHIQEYNPTHSIVAVVAHINERGALQITKVDGHTRGHHWKLNPESAPKILTVNVFPVSSADVDADTKELYDIYTSAAASATKSEKHEHANALANFSPKTDRLKSKMSEAMRLSGHKDIDKGTVEFCNVLQEIDKWGIQQVVVPLPKKPVKPKKPSKAMGESAVAAYEVSLAKFEKDSEKYKLKKKAVAEQNKVNKNYFERKYNSGTMSAMMKSLKLHPVKARRFWMAFIAEDYSVPGVEDFILSLELDEDMLVSARAAVGCSAFGIITTQKIMD